MEVTSLVPIGTKIKVNKSKIENLLQNKLMENLPQIINGEIIDYKMTDGMGIGYVLMTKNDLKIWIFKNELNEDTIKEYEIEHTNKDNRQNNNDLTIGKNKVTYYINGNRKIKSVTNPFNLINWLIFTLKDII